MARYKLVEGWTGPVKFTLKVDGLAQNLTGMTVELVLTGNDGVAIDTAGDVTVPDAANGVVQYNPDLADLTVLKSELLAHWKVTDGGGKVVFFPNGAADVWEVHRP